MSYDYDYVIMDWESDTFIIVVGGSEYEYSISEHGDLLSGALENGVPFSESGGGEGEENEKPFNTDLYESDSYDEGYDDNTYDDGGW